MSKKTWLFFSNCQTFAMEGTCYFLRIEDQLGLPQLPSMIPGSRPDTDEQPLSTAAPTGMISARSADRRLTDLRRTDESERTTCFRLFIFYFNNCGCLLSRNNIDANHHGVIFMNGVMAMHDITTSPVTEPDVQLHLITGIQREHVFSAVKNATVDGLAVV